MGRKAFRQRKTITRVSRPDIEWLLRKDQVYKLNGYDCDLLVKDFNANEVYLVEEKTTLNRYNYGVAALQLLLGKAKIHRYTSYVVVKQIILAESKLFNDKKIPLMNTEEYFHMQDIIGDKFLTE